MARFIDHLFNFKSTENTKKKEFEKKVFKRERKRRISEKKVFKRETKRRISEKKVIKRETNAFQTKVQTLNWGKHR